MAISLPQPTTPEEDAAHTLIRRFETTGILSRATVDTAFVLWLIEQIGLDQAPCGRASRAYLIAARASGQIHKSAWYWSLTMIHHHPAHIVTPAFKRWTPHLMTSLRNVYTLALSGASITRAQMDAQFRATVPPGNDDPTNTMRLTLTDYTGARHGYRRLLLLNGL